MRTFLRPVLALVALALVMTAPVAAESNDDAFLQLEEDAARVEEVFEYRGDSHYEFGLRMGERFRDKIQQRFASNAKLQTLLLPYVRTADGLALYAKYIDSHSRTFPVGCGSRRGWDELGCSNVSKRVNSTTWPSSRASRTAAASPSRYLIINCSG